MLSKQNTNSRSFGLFMLAGLGAVTLFVIFAAHNNCSDTKHRQLAGLLPGCDNELHQILFGNAKPIEGLEKVTLETKKVRNSRSMAWAHKLSNTHTQTTFEFKKYGREVVVAFKHFTMNYAKLQAITCDEVSKNNNRRITFQFTNWDEECFGNVCDRYIYINDETEESVNKIVELFYNDSLRGENPLLIGFDDSILRWFDDKEGKCVNTTGSEWTTWDKQDLVVNAPGCGRFSVETNKLWITQEFETVEDILYRNEICGFQIYLDGNVRTEEPHVTVYGDVELNGKHTQKDIATIYLTNAENIQKWNEFAEWFNPSMVYETMLKSNEWMALKDDNDRWNRFVSFDAAVKKYE